jgi:hypothetical protein
VRKGRKAAAPIIKIVELLKDNPFGISAFYFRQYLLFHFGSLIRGKQLHDDSYKEHNNVFDVSFRGYC